MDASCYKLVQCNQKHLAGRKLNQKSNAANYAEKTSY